MNTFNLGQRALLLLALTGVLSGCTEAQAVKEAPPLEVMISQPVREKIVDWDTYTGTVEPKESVEIRAQVRGEIKAVSFKEGDEIKAGAKLFTIDSEPFKADRKQAEGMLKAWQTELTLAEKTIELYKPLAETGTVSKEELLKAVASKDKALANIITTQAKIAEADVNIKYCDITSPIGGKVSQALLTKGNIANAAATNSLLTTVVSVDPMYVYFYVNERALRQYEKVLRDTAAKAAGGAKVPGEAKAPGGAKAPSEVKAPGGGKNDAAQIPAELALLGDTGYPFKGIIDFVDNRVDPKTGSIKVRGRFDNPKGADGRRPLTAGLFARIRVAIAEPYPAILVADRAILTDQSLKYVLIVNKAKNNEVERKDITPANRVQPDGLRAINAGLTGDEWIIVEGVNRARPGVSVNPKEESMPRRPADGK